MKDNKVKVSVFVKQSELEEINSIMSNLEDAGFDFTVSSVLRSLMLEGLKQRKISKDMFQ